MVFNQCWNENVEGGGLHLKWRVSILLSSGALVAALWKSCKQPPACGCPDALDFSCHSLPVLFIELDTSAAVEMDIFLLTVPCMCPPCEVSPGISIARTEGRSTAVGNAG